MKRMEGFREKLIRILPILTAIFWLAQPVLDVLGYWQIKLYLPNTVTLAVRFVLMTGALLIGFFLSDRKWIYFLTAGILALLTAGHAVANMLLPVGYHEALADLVNLVRIYYMPLMTLCLITFMKQNDRVYTVCIRCCVVNLVLIGAVMLVSTLTGTDPHTYRHEGIGVMGWFYWANSQSAILAMGMPIAICWALKKWPDKLLPVALITLLTELQLFVFGTRLTLLTMVSGGFALVACLLIMDRKRWKQACVIGLITALLTGGYFVSPTKARAVAVEEQNEANQELIEEYEVEISWPEDEEQPEENVTPVMKESEREKMERIYRGYMAGVVQHFGFDRVAAAYNYTLDSEILGNWRTYKLVFCRLLMEDSGPLNRLFGMSIQDMREFVQWGVHNERTGEWEDGYVIMDVENDFHGIYFILGIVGLVLMCGFLLYFGLRGLLACVRNFKTYFNLDMIGAAGAYVYGLAHAWFTVSVLRRNNASIYMALVLACLWYLSRKEAAGGPLAGKKQAAKPSGEEA